MTKRTWFVTWEEREVRGAHVDAETHEEALALVMEGGEEGKWVESLDSEAYAVADEHGVVWWPSHDLTLRPEPAETP